MSPVFNSPASGGSNDTRQIQRALNNAGGSLLPPLVEDGIFGSKTRARVVEFQRSKGLKPDGIVGPKTRAALGLTSSPGVAPPPVPAPGGGAVNSGSVVSTVVAATRASFSAWKLAASFGGIQITGPIAVGGPGCLRGPNMTALINSRVGGLQGTDKAIAQAAAAGIGENFQTWQNGVTVPGLPWYPAFAAFPGPLAPPIPNVPSPLIALASAGIGGLANPPALQNAMEQVAGPTLLGKAGTVFAEIAGQVSPLLFGSISSTFVSGVMGTGPVPTFAPPASPVGPVVGGFVLEPSGQLT